MTEEWDRATGEDEGSPLLQMGGGLQSMLDEVAEAGTNPGLLPAVPTGFGDLDRLLNGLHPGQLVVIGGATGIGKTTLALDFARNAALRHNLATIMFCAEQPPMDLLVKAVSAEARVPLTVLRSGQLTDDDWTRLSNRLKAGMADAPLFFSHAPEISLADIESTVMEGHVGGNQLRLVIVDYLQLLDARKPKGEHQNRYEEVAYLVRGLKILGRKARLPVVVVSQLNRKFESRRERAGYSVAAWQMRPQLADLRDAGAIEDHADVVILLHRDDYYDKESPRAGEADFIVAKHRSGPTDIVTVAAQLHFSRFVDMAV